MKIAVNGTIYNARPSSGGKDYTAGFGVKIEDDTISVIHPNVPLTQAEYDALSQEEKMNGSIYIITDQELQIGGEEIYSTEETRIGTWIDGKPLYRKVVYCPNVSLPVSTTWQQVAPPIDNLKDVCFLSVVAGNSESWNIAMSILPVSTASGNVSFVYNQVKNANQPSGFCVQINHSAYNKVNFCFQIEYTKTTDSPEEVS